MARRSTLPSVALSSSLLVTVGACEMEVAAAGKMHEVAASEISKTHEAGGGGKKHGVAAQ